MSFKSEWKCVHIWYIYIYMYKYHHISTFLGCHPGLAMWFTGQRGGQKSPVLVINPCCVCVWLVISSFCGKKTYSMLTLQQKMLVKYSIDLVLSQFSACSMVKTPYLPVKSQVWMVPYPIFSVVIQGPQLLQCIWSSRPPGAATKVCIFIHGYPWWLIGIDQQILMAINGIDIPISMAIKCQ